MEKRRIVITGMGLVSPIGNSVDEAWQHAKNGVSGIDWLRHVPIADGVNPVAGWVRDFDAETIFGKRDARRIDRVTQFALVAAKQALDDSGLEVTPENSYDIGCIMGTGVGAIHAIRDTVLEYVERNAKGVSPVIVPSLLSDNIGAKVSIDFGLRGPNYSIITACATGNNVIGDCADQIRLGRAKVMLAGASEAAFVELVMAGFNNMKALTQRSDDPTKASRPFDLHRDGFVASEGAAVLVLEDLEHAQARGARIYAEVSGYGHTSDAYHVTAPHPEGDSAARAMQLALQEAGLQPKDISYINAHGTGTALNDKSETLAIKKALGEEAYNIPISSTKSMTGHLLSASGSIEAILSVMAIQNNFVPPTINLDTPDPDCDLNYTPHVGRTVAIEHVMSNSFGFGGHNAVVVFSRYKA